MILVTTGSNGSPFDRLLRVIDDVETDEDIVVQHGPSDIRPSGAACVAFMPFARLQALIADASTVVTHGGVGSVLTALAHGKRPIVVPRLPEYGEVVDRHQLDFARRLAQADLIILAEDAKELPQILADSPRLEIERSPKDSALIDDLSAYVRSVLHSPHGAASRERPR